MRIVFLIVLMVTTWLLMDYHSRRLDVAYHRGYIDGIASVKKPNLDTACASWWFGSNIIDAKKRLCGK